MDELPSEFLKRPLPLVALLGHTALHPSIAKLFSPAGFRDEPDAPSIATISLELDVAQLPKRKPKRTNYDNYTPAGIIKISWLHKHMSILPAVVVLFFALDEKKIPDADVLQQLEILRSQPRYSSMKYLMVIVQKSGSTDPFSDERVSFLRKRAEQILDTKLTFFLFNKDDMKGSVKRLEEQLKPLATLCYKEDIKRIKKEADKLPKHTHLLLLIRLKFKIAFLHEQTQNFQSAFKYYNQSYNLLREMPRNSINAVYEQKAVAEFFQLKMTKLLLAHQLFDFPNDAITQFTRHVRNYRSSFGVPEREFEHWAWMCRQYQVFGELLERTYATSTTSGPLAFVPSLQSPAYYFQHAAIFAIRRKKHARRMAELLRNSPAFEKFTREKSEWIRSPYLGHPSSLALHPLDAQPVVADEMDANYRVVFSELLAKIDYSAHIILLLTRAFEYFKTSRYVRYANTLATLIATEHLDSFNFAVAKKWLERPTSFYRREHWTSLLALSLAQHAEIATKLQNTGDFIQHIVESLSLPGDQTSRLHLQQRLDKALHHAAELSLPPLTSPLLIDLPTKLVVPVVSFDQPAVPVGEPAQLTILLDSLLPAAFSLDAIRVLFKDLSETADLQGNLSLPPLQRSSFAVSFLPPKQATEVECTELRLECSNLTLRFPLAELESVPSADAPYVKEKPPRRLLRVEQPRPNLALSVKDKAPALVGELYRLSITLTALGAQPVSGSLECSVEMTERSVAPADSSVLGEVLAGGLPLTSLPFQVTPGAPTLLPLLFRSSNAGDRRLHFRAQFSDSVQSGLLTSVLPVSIHQPLDVAFDVTPLYAHHGDGVPPIIVNEQFLICAEARANTEHALHILKADVIPDSSTTNPPASLLSSSFDGLVTSGSQPPQVHGDAKVRFWFLMTPNVAGLDLSLGHLALRWRHVSSADEATFTVPLPRIKIQRTPFSAVIDCPAHAVVGEPINVSICIHNNTNFLQEFVLTVKEADAFVLTGLRGTSFRIPPNKDFRLRYVLVALAAGRHALPHFHVLSKRYDKELPQTKLKRFVYVQPT